VLIRNAVFVGCWVALVCASRVATAQQVVQLALTYNADVVREPGGTGGGIDPSNNLGPGGRGFVTQAEAAANDPTDPHGLPDNGVLAVPGGTVQFGPYNGNNALLLTSLGGSFGYSGEQLAGFDTLEVYGAGQGAVMGTPSGAGLQAFFDTASDNGYGYGGFTWDSPAPPGATTGTATYVLSGLDRTGPGGAGFEDVDGVNLVRWSIPIPRASPLNSITFTVNPNGGPSDQRIAILAVTATRVPEPSAAGAFGIAALLAMRRRRR
jgi:hypothetical protein